MENGCLCPHRQSCRDDRGTRGYARLDRMLYAFAGYAFHHSLTVIIRAIKEIQGIAFTFSHHSDRELIIYQTKMPGLY